MDHDEGSQGDTEKLVSETVLRNNLQDSVNREGRQRKVLKMSKGISHSLQMIKRDIVERRY